MEYEAVASRLNLQRIDSDISEDGKIVTCEFHFRTDFKQYGNPTSRYTGSLSRPIEFYKDLIFHLKYEVSPEPSSITAEHYISRQLDDAMINLKITGKDFRIIGTFQQSSPMKQYTPREPEPADHFIHTSFDNTDYQAVITNAHEDVNVALTINNKNIDIKMRLEWNS